MEVVVFSCYELVAECFSQSVDSSRGIRVVGVAQDKQRLFRLLENRVPDVLLLRNCDHSEKLLTLVSETSSRFPNTKILIVTSSDEPIDQAEALRLGASGLICPNKSVEVMARAINQVASGELWLNQTLVTQLLNPSFEKSEPTDDATHELTPREIEVVKAIALGLKNKEVSKALYISEATVRHHLSSIYSKLYVADRLNLIIYAYQHGLVEHPELELVP